MKGEVQLERVGEVVMAKVRGEPTVEVLRETQERILRLIGDSGSGKVLYDVLDMEPPPVDVPWSQRELDAQLGSVKLRRAIVVPDTRIAYLARLAFGEGDYRVFYNDRAAALEWLNASHSTSH